MSTFNVCDSIFEAANAKGDERMLFILSWVNKDIVAAESKYHRSCLASYNSKSNLKK